MPVLTNSKECETFLRYIYRPCMINKTEITYVVFLDRCGKRIDHKCLRKGRYSMSVVDERKILAKAFKLNSNHVVIAHNHPCGDPRPSEGDIKETNRLNDILESLEIILIDHIILTESEYYSFKDAGLIKPVRKAS